jgi:hypothetical protein
MRSRHALSLAGFVAHRLPLHPNRLERSPERRQRWLTFLRNHREAIVAMDFFTVPTATFRVLYVWFAIKHLPDDPRRRSRRIE